MGGIVLVAWYARQPMATLYLTSTVVAELSFGIELLPDGRRRHGFEAWLTERVLHAFEGRILLLDVEDGLLCGRLMAAGGVRVGRRGWAMPRSLQW